MTTTERFFKKVNMSGPTLREELGPCWEWVGAIQTGGYGSFRYRGKTDKAHRVAWHMEYGDLPEAVLHKCDNRRCVRVGHLFKGTKAINNADRKNKNRNGNHKGEHNGRAILTAPAVLAIRTRYANGVGPTQLAREYAVSLPAIWYALKRGWKHLG